MLLNVFVQQQQSNNRGGSRIFMGGGGGAQQIMCAYADHEREERSPLRPGSRARLFKGPGRSQSFLLLSRAI